MTEKIPPVLSDEDINELWRKLGYRHLSTDIIAQAQRDADVAYYEPLIQQSKEENERLKSALAEYWQALIERLEEAKEEVAREAIKIVRDYFSLGNYCFCQTYLPYIVVPADGRAVIKALKDKEW